MEKITEEVYRNYLITRLKGLKADLEGFPEYMDTENKKIQLEMASQLDYIMFQLYQLDAEPEE